MAKAATENTILAAKDTKNVSGLKTEPLHRTPRPAVKEASTFAKLNGSRADGLPPVSPRDMTPPAIVGREVGSCGTGAGVLAALPMP